MEKTIRGKGIDEEKEFEDGEIHISKGRRKR